MVGNLTSLRLAVLGMTMMLLTACGGGGGGVNAYNVSATSGAGGSISPPGATVNAGGTTSFTVTPNSGYVVGSVTGCGGTLSGNTYTTGTIKSDCTVTADFAAAFTWVAGPDTGSGKGTYGMRGVAAMTNVPGARYSPAARHDAASWTGADGNLWLFGGWSGSGGANYRWNDLWKYSPSSGQWTWVDGADTVNAKGVYGAEGVAAATNVPGARDAAAAWTDASGNLWLFGGYWQDSAGAQSRWNDLWRYSPSSGQWTWIDGSSTTNATGVYGAQGVAAATNVPGARDITGVWSDASGNLWLFGGVGYDATGTLVTMNDLWKYPTQ